MTQIPGIGSPDSSTTNALDPTAAIGSPTKTARTNAHGTLRRWDVSPPPAKREHWSGNRTRAIQHARRAAEAQVDPRTCVSATWLLEQLQASAKCLYPLLERRIPRQDMPVGAKWKLSLRHLHAIRVIATAQFDCGADRPNGLIGSHDELAALFVCSESTAKRVLADLKKWHLVDSVSRTRPARDGVGSWAARNCYRLSDTAISYWSITRRTLRPGPAKRLSRKAAPEQSIPVNPDGMRPANPEVHVGPPNSTRENTYSLPDTNSPRRVKQPAGSGENFGPAQPAAPPAPRASSAKSENRATPPPAVDAKLQPPVRVTRSTDEEESAAKMQLALLRHFGEPTPDELAAIALLRRGGRA